MPGFLLSACVYTSSEGTLTVAVGPKNVSQSDFDSLMKLVPGLTQVSGVGDDAYMGQASTSVGGGASIFVLSGQTYFTIQAASTTKSSSELQQSLQTLAATAVKNVP